MPKVHPEYEDGYSKGYESGYQFGRESADCHAVKRDLAEKVLAAIKALPRMTWATDGGSMVEADYGSYLDRNDLDAAIKSVFAQVGIELTTTQQQEG